MYDGRDNDKIMSENECMKCPDCGSILEKGRLSCPECGCPISNMNVTSEHTKKKFAKNILSVLVFLVACVFFYNSYLNIVDDNYKYYMDDHARFIQEYAENTATSEDYSAGFFRRAYQGIADTYMKLADDAMEKIWQYRIKAIAYGAAGVVLVVAVFFIQKERKKQ